MLQIIGAVAEFEKDIIREKVIAGLENAKRKDKKLGRPKIHDKIWKKQKNYRSKECHFGKLKINWKSMTIRKKLNSQIATCKHISNSETHLFISPANQ